MFLFAEPPCETIRLPFKFKQSIFTATKTYYKCTTEAILGIPQVKRYKINILVCHLT